jgi:hypothetical protein
MGVVVAFSYQAWITRYPEFADTVTSDLAGAYFAEATIYHRNDGGGPVSTANSQSILLNMATAHIAQLYSGTAAQPASQLVGRISNASEGSVSVSADMTIEAGTEGWWAQTKYGLSYWAATSQYRRMRYRPGFGRAIPPFPFG